MSFSTLPAMEHSFSINTEGTDTKQRFTGNFTYKRPNIRLKSDISKMTARLNEDLQNLDEDVAFLHFVLSTLRYTLTNMPDWWKEADYGMDLYDTNVILDIYKAVRKFETSYFEELYGQQDKAVIKKKKKDKPSKSEATKAELAGLPQE